MSSTFISSFLFTLAVIVTAAYAEEFQVGGPVGWRIPSTNETELYNVWASRRRFHVNDSLRFHYTNNSVSIVEKWGFYHCNSSNPIAFYNDGDTVINLDNVGTVYFIGDADRCKEGVKMMVEVKGPSPVRYIPPSVASPPEDAYSAMAPSPARVISYGSSPDMSPGLAPGPASSGSLVSVSASGFVTAVILGVGICGLKC